MKVKQTWIWNFKMFYAVELLKKIIREEEQYKDDKNFGEYWGDPPPLKINDYPFFHWLKIHLVEEDGEKVYYFERPYSSTVGGVGGGTTYAHCFKKIHDSYIPALIAML